MSIKDYTFTRLLVLAVLVSAAGGSRMEAQSTTTATILGTITDTSGAVIAGAAVQVKNVDTGLTQSTSSDEQGRFRVQGLLVGEYEVEATKAGFQALVHKGITLTVGGQSVVDFALQIGQAQQTITVEGEVSQVETTSSTVDSLVDQQQIRELPLNGRNFEQLIFLAPGVQQVTTGQQTSFYGVGNTYSVAGSRPEGQLLLLDDTNIQTFWNHGSGAGILGTSLGIDAIAEFQTLTNTYSAQFGGNGAVVNAVSKSGTNSFHGSAFDFLRNSALDARNFFDPHTIPPFRRNQYGGTLGGPIKKDKAFFFVNYEGLSQLLGQSAIALVPDANARAGYLPCATAPNFSCNSSTGLANVGVNPSMVPFLSLYPQATSEIGGGIGQTYTSGNQTAQENYVLARFDYTLSDKDSIFARYVSDSANRFEPFTNSAPAVPTWPEQDETHNQFATIEERHIISPTLINLARVAFSRPDTSAYTTNSTAPLDFFPGSGRQNGIVTISGLSNIGASSLLPFDLIQNKFNIADDLNLTRGTHSIKIGLGIDRVNSNINGPNNTGGSYAFTSLANFLAANANTFTSYLPPTVDAWRYVRAWEIKPYFQDDWKISPRLTMNLGVRYEFSNNPTCTPCNFVINMATATGFTNVPTLFIKNPSTKNIDPRIGVAFDPFKDHKTSIRAGFGIFHDLVEARTAAPGLWMSPPNISFTTQNPTFPVPTLTGVSVLPQAENQTILTTTTPYMIQYNLNVQRDFGGNILSLGYVGSRGVHLFSEIENNPPIPVILPNGQYQFASLIGGKIVTNPRINPLFGPGKNVPNGSTSRYNSLQASLTRRLTANVQAQVSYTFSRCIDDGSAFGGQESNVSTAIIENPYNRDSDKALCSFDIEQALRVNGVVTLPFKGNKLVEGWQMTGIASASGGAPFSVTDGFDQAGVVTSQSRPNYVSGCNPAEGLPTQWFNPACYSLQPVGTLGNNGRNTVRLANLVDVDYAVMKETPIPKISEQFRIQFRAEFFNIFNHTNFGNPTVGAFVQGPNGTGNISPTAGKITTTIGTSRQIQFGIKVLF